MDLKRQNTFHFLGSWKRFGVTSSSICVFVVLAAFASFLPFCFMCFFLCVIVEFCVLFLFRCDSALVVSFNSIFRWSNGPFLTFKTLFVPYFLYFFYFQYSIYKFFGCFLHKMMELLTCRCLPLFWSFTILKHKWKMIQLFRFFDMAFSFFAKSILLCILWVKKIPTQKLSSYFDIYIQCIIHSKYTGYTHKIQIIHRIVVWIRENAKK